MPRNRYGAAPMKGTVNNMMKEEEQINNAKNQLADIKMTQFLKNKIGAVYAWTAYACQ